MLPSDDERAAIRTLHGNNVPLDTIAAVLELCVAACDAVVKSAAAVARLPATEAPPAQRVVRKNSKPHESELLGAPVADSGQRFGYNWYARTVGHGAIRVEWSRRGIQSLVVSNSTSCSNKAKFVATKTASWFILMKDEYFTEIRVRESESRDCITALCLQTNLRRSQWYGAVRGEVRTLTAPRGFCIFSLHGSHKDSVLQNLGVYFLPLVLLDSANARTALWIADSKIIGDLAPDAKSLDHFRSSFGNTRAIVVSTAPHLDAVRFFASHQYQRCLAVTDSPLGEGESMLVLAEREYIFQLRACITNGYISAIQFGTTHRTTEWFGAAPTPGALIETRHIQDSAHATNVGGIVGMRRDGRIRSLSVMFYRSAELRRAISWGDLIFLDAPVEVRDSTQARIGAVQPTTTTVDVNDKLGKGQLTCF